MAIIRQEINILDHIWASDASTGERVQLDTTKYSGTVTYYFETVGKVASGTLTLTLRREGTATDDATINITATSYTRQRVSFTPPAGQTVYVINGVNGTSPFLTSARIIVFQNAATISTTETQVEIGEYNDSTTSVSDVPMTNPKYWLYTAANWNGAIMFYFEAVIGGSNTKSGGTATLQADNTSYGGWANVTNTALGPTTSILPVRYRSAAFNIGVTGTHYRLVYKSGTSKSPATVYGAKIIIDQKSSADDQFTYGSNQNFVQGGTASSGQTLQAIGQSYTAGSSYSIGSIDLEVFKVASPTDNLLLEILTTSLTGTVIGTSNTVAATGLGTANGVYVNFSFSSPVSITNGTKYYLRLTRSGARDTTNYCKWTLNNGSVLANGGAYTLDNNTWSAESATNDQCFRINTTTGITLMEPQYLLLNIRSVTTGLQNNQTLWDSTEWSSVTNVYKHALEGSGAEVGELEDINNSNAVVTNSALTITAGQQTISSDLTMPTTGHEIDTKYTTKVTALWGSRILVAVTILTGIPNKILAILQAVNRTSTY